MEIPDKSQNYTVIYQIVNTVNNNSYIGSAINFYKRILEHSYNLDANKHSNNHLQNAWNLYKRNNFETRILEFLDISDFLNKIEKRHIILKAEQYWIDLLNPEYNIAKIAGSRLGLTHSEISRDKISKSKKGKKWSDKKREAYLLNKNNYGRKRLFLPIRTIEIIKFHILTPKKCRLISRKELCKKLNITESIYKEIQRGTMFSEITNFENKRIKKRLTKKG